MADSTLREKLHQLIEEMPENKLSEVYAWLEDEYTDEFKAELDAEFEAYKKDGEVIPEQEVNKMVDELLYGRK
jgi:hypothetical protein